VRTRTISELTLAVAAIVSSGCAFSCGAGQPPSCRTAAECRPGHSCDNGSCSSNCNQALCGAREECISQSGECLAVECGNYTRCLAAGQLCDAAVFACFRTNGSCSTVASCPPLAPDVSLSATTSCEGGFCRVKAIPLGQILGLEGGSVVAVDTPFAAQAFATVTDVIFQWRGPADAASIVLVLDAAVSYDTDVQAHAIWGAVRGVAAERTARVADGHVIHNGVWLGGPGEVPAGRPLFFLAQLVRPQGLVGSSPLVPFIVGGSWPQPGTACGGLGGPSGECANPGQPMICNGGVCSVVCLSQLDCPSGLGCGGFMAGTRVCE